MMPEPGDNVDAREVHRFTRRAGDWWRPDGPFRALHVLNGARLDYILRHRALDAVTVADIGCGGGILAEAMARQGARVTGLDAGQENIAAARQHAEAGGLSVDYRTGTVATLLDEGGEQGFDLVTCMEMLEHVPEPSALVQDCSRLLRPGGLLICSTLHRCPKAWFAAIFLAEYCLSLLPRGTHRYERFIRPSELAAWCRASGLQVFDLCGLHYLPWPGRAWLGADTGINYLLAAHRQGGAG